MGLQLRLKGWFRPSQQKFADHWVNAYCLVKVEWNPDVCYRQRRSEAKCHPGPTIRAPPFPPHEFAYKNLG